MKTILYHISTENEKWINEVVEDFRYICTSGLYKKCDKIHVTIDSHSGEEWIKYFWGRLSNEKEIEVHVVNEPPDMENWIAFYPDVIYSNTNLKR